MSDGCSDTAACSSCLLASPVPKSRPVKRPARTSDDIGGDNKRCRVARKSLRMVSNNKGTGEQICGNVDAKHAVDTKCAVTTVFSERTYTQTMEYFEQLCKRLDTMEPAGTQDSGPNARNPKILPTWHTQLVEWMLNFPRDADVQNSTIAVAVVYMQRFLTVKKQISKQWLQLLAMVCTFIASKVNESHSKKCVTMRFLTQFVANQRYTAHHIKQFERELLKSLEWNLHPVTAHALTMVMLELHPDKTERAKIMKVADILLKMQLPNKEFLKWSTKAIALGCCSAACAITGFTEGYKNILSHISDMVDHEAVVESEKLNGTLRRMFFTIFPEQEHSEKHSSGPEHTEKRSYSPASIVGPIKANS